MNEESPKFVRFGPPPKNGHSVNYGAGAGRRKLAGVSAFEGRLTEPGLFRIDFSELRYPEGAATLITLAASDRPAFFIEGSEVVGKGGDGEPLVVVERWWPVPKSVGVTCTELITQPALALWSNGPRDGSGARHLHARLKGGSEYTPGFRFESEHFLEGQHGGGTTKKETAKKKAKRKAARKAKRKAARN